MGFASPRSFKAAVGITSDRLSKVHPLKFLSPVVRSIREKESQKMPFLAFAHNPPLPNTFTKIRSYVKVLTV